MKSAKNLMIKISCFLLCFTLSSFSGSFGQNSGVTKNNPKNVLLTAEQKQELADLDDGFAKAGDEKKKVEVEVAENKIAITKKDSEYTAAVNVYETENSKMKSVCPLCLTGYHVPPLESGEEDTETLEYYHSLEGPVAALANKATSVNAELIELTATKEDLEFKLQQADLDLTKAKEALDRFWARFGMDFKTACLEGLAQVGAYAFDGATHPDKLGCVMGVDDQGRTIIALPKDVKAQKDLLINYCKNKNVKCIGISGTEDKGVRIRRITDLNIPVPSPTQSTGQGKK